MSGARSSPCLPPPCLPLLHDPRTHGPFPLHPSPLGLTPTEGGPSYRQASPRPCPRGSVSLGSPSHTHRVTVDEHKDTERDPILLRHLERDLNSTETLLSSHPQTQITQQTHILTYSLTHTHTQPTLVTTDD